MSAPQKTSSASERAPVTDSPWFWAYLFATGGLVALFLMGPKYDSRQAQIEREFSARQSHGHTVSGNNGPIKPPLSGEQNLRLGPFYIIIGAIFITAWSAFWYQRFRTTKNSQPLPGKRNE